MSEKLFTEKGQLRILETEDYGVMLERLGKLFSICRDVMVAAKERCDFLNLGSEFENDRQQRLYARMSVEEAREIAVGNDGYIYPSVFKEMLRRFPEESKKLWRSYQKHCSIPSEAQIFALRELGKNAKEFLSSKYLKIDVFNEILRVFSKDEVVDILIEMSKNKNWDMANAVVDKIYRVVPKGQRRKLWNGFLNAVPKSLVDFDMCRAFMDFETTEERKAFLQKAIDLEMDLDDRTLAKIARVFSANDAKELFDDFFATGPGGEYTKKEKDDLYALIP